jgi:hypothetical protein
MPPNPGGFALQEGWYGCVSGIYVNKYIYWRVPDMKDAELFTATEAFETIQDMRKFGYKCHVEPPLVITFKL